MYFDDQLGGVSSQLCRVTINDKKEVAVQDGKRFIPLAQFMHKYDPCRASTSDHSGKLTIVNEKLIVVQILARTP